MTNLDSKTVGNAANAGTLCVSIVHPRRLTVLAHVAERVNDSMKKYIFAYLAGLAASIPAFTMFGNVGASPFRNFDAMMSHLGGSISSIIIYFALIWAVPALGAAIGAKLGGCGYGFQHIYGRGIAGQFAFSILFSLLIMFVPQVGNPVLSYTPSVQTIAFLMFSQIGCSISANWG